MNDVNLQAGGAVGIEVSNSMLRAVALDKNADKIQSAQMPLNRGREIFEQIADFINQLKNEFGGFDKIGIAIPGLLDLSTKRIALSKHNPEHTKINLADEINKRTNVAAVLENDANAGAYGEYILGAGRGSRDVLYVTLGEGVGGAFIFNGTLWRGAAGFAGELGYITINSDGNTLEDVASYEGIVRRVNIRINQDKTSSLARLKEEDLNVAEIVRAANDGDGFAQMMLKRTGGFVGVALATVINLLNIGKIVVGGDVMDAGNCVLEGIKESAGELSFRPSFETTEIVAGKLGADAKAVGAALLSQANGNA